MDQIKLKITGDLSDTGRGQMRFSFRISPLLHNSPVFVFHAYCLDEDLHKERHGNRRREIAKILRDRHSAAWRRYHDWREENDNKRKRSGAHSIAGSDVRRAR